MGTTGADPGIYIKGRSLAFLPLPFSFSPLLILPSPALSLPLRSRAPLNQLLGERCKLSQRGLGVWGGTPAENEFNAL